jgi:hypothetical protein
MLLTASDGKVLLGVLFWNFTVKPMRGTREFLQITELLPLWIVELGKSLSFPSAANPEASDRWNFSSPSFIAIAFHSVTIDTRLRFGGNTAETPAAEPAPVIHY